MTYSPVAENMLAGTSGSPSPATVNVLASLLELSLEPLLPLELEELEESSGSFELEVVPGFLALEEELEEELAADEEPEGVEELEDELDAEEEFGDEPFEFEALEEPPAPELDATTGPEAPTGI